MKNNKHIVKTTNMLYHKGGSDKELHFYESKSGKNLILEYIDSLSVNEQIDGYSVLQCLEEGRMDEIIYIYCMPAENRKKNRKTGQKDCGGKSKRIGKRIRKEFYLIGGIKHGLLKSKHCKYNRKEKKKR